jgi:integrase
VDIRLEGKRYRRKSQDDSRSGALDLEARLRQRLQLTGPRSMSTTDGHAPTFRAFAQQWFVTYAKTNLKPTTIRTYDTALRLHLLPRLGELAIDAIGTQHVETLKGELLAAHLSPKSINNLLSALRKILDTARDWGRLETLPRVRWLKVPPQRFNVLVREEIVALESVTDDVDGGLMILCALRTGMRRGELLGLRWEDIDLTNNVLVVRRSVVGGIESSPKNNRARVIPLSSDLGLRLRAISPGASQGRVFTSRSRRPFATITVERLLHRACDAAGIRRIGWHALRHTFASQLIWNGASLVPVQGLLGHSTIQMTMRYTHVSLDELRKAIALLSPDQNGHRSGHHAVGAQDDGVGARGIDLTGMPRGRAENEETPPA